LVLNARTGEEKTVNDRQRRLLTRIRRIPHRLSLIYADQLAAAWARTHERHHVPTLTAIGPARPRSQRRIAVVCHAFYTDLLPELKELFEHLPPGTDLFFSVTTEAARAVALEEFADYALGEVEVRVVENKGRDIAPKYVTFADVIDGEYELILYLHTKKSTDRRMGLSWRQHLYGHLLGSDAAVAEILAQFDADPALGVVAPPHFEPVLKWTDWSGNFPQAAALARRMGLSLTRWSPPDFPSGSMFWARPQALQPINRLGLTLDEFPEEGAQIQDTVMHALERFVYLAAAEAGYRSATIAPTSPPASSPAPAVESAASRTAGRPSWRMRASAAQGVWRVLRGADS
jgi:lipopolysaccharide biosynthesis protein